MKYLLALICPPLVLMIEGKVFQIWINIILCFCGWIPAVVHALFIAFTEDQERRHEETIAVLRKAIK